MIKKEDVYRVLEENGVYLKEEYVDLLLKEVNRGKDKSDYELLDIYIKDIKVFGFKALYDAISGAIIPKKTCFTLFKSIIGVYEYNKLIYKLVKDYDGILEKQIIINKIMCICISDLINDNTPPLPRFRMLVSSYILYKDRLFIEDLFKETKNKSVCYKI